MTHRRQFLAHLGAGSMIPFLPLKLQTDLLENQDKSDTTIGEVEVIQFSGPYRNIPGYNRQYQSQPIHIYPSQRPSPYRQPTDMQEKEGTISQYYIRIRTKGGIEGLYGAIDPETVTPILSQFREFLIGKNALNIEQTWDQLYRRNRHSRAGHYMMALSAVDNAIWDIRGKYFGVPVYQLLGGGTREFVQVYGSCLGYPVAPGEAGPKAKELFDKGFVHQKWFLADSPVDGQVGLERAIGLVRELREAGGYHLQLMFDAFMAWDIPFATSWAKAVEPYHPYWIEEAFPPNRLDSFIELAESTSIQIATGEHFYNRWEVLNFLKAGAISIVQADPEWCGGVSELVKICHIASAFGAKVFPHGHNIPAALHVVSSQSPEVCPLVEYLINHVGYKLHFYKDPPLTENGRLALPTKPGFGIEIDTEKVAQSDIVIR